MSVNLKVKIAFSFLVVFHFSLLMNVSLKYGGKNKKLKYSHLLAHLPVFVNIPRPGDSEVIFSVFESSCHLLLPVVQSNHPKVEEIPFSVLPKDTTSKLAGLSSHYLFYSERQARKL